MNCTFNIALHFVTHCRLRGERFMRSRVVPCHILIIIFLAGRLCCGANLIFDLGFTFGGHEADLFSA